jgi:hypothetical protein
MIDIIKSLSCTAMVLLLAILYGALVSGCQTRIYETPDLSDKEGMFDVSCEAQFGWNIPVDRYPVIIYALWTHRKKQEWIDVEVQFDVEKRTGIAYIYDSKKKLAGCRYVVSPEVSPKPEKPDGMELIIK